MSIAKHSRKKYKGNSFLGLFFNSMRAKQIRKKNHKPYDLFLNFRESKYKTTTLWIVIHGAPVRVSVKPRKIEVFYILSADERFPTV